MSNQKESVPANTITVHNKISPNYRELHVDGAFGGITTRGLINISFYAERRPIPKSTKFEITEAGKVGKAIANSEDSKDGLLREFEFGIYMNLDTTKSLINFLVDHVAKIESLLNEEDNGKPESK